MIQAKSTTAVDPLHLKAKRYHSNQKNYRLTISIQKLSSIHKIMFKIQGISGSHELKGHCHF